MWIGVDPGGKDAFGLAMLDEGGRFSTHCFSCADEAIKQIGERPTGVGIDAPMWWSSGPSGDRLADQWIRNRHHIGGSTVQAMNSLRGACLIQGILFAERVRRLFPTVPITETHPTAYLRAFGHTWPEFCTSFSVNGTAENMHRQHALMSAVAAREGFEGRWTIDLSENRHECEQDPSSYWLAPMHYFWHQAVDDSSRQ